MVRNTIYTLEDAETWCCALIDIMDDLGLIRHNPLDAYDAPALVMLYTRLMEYPHR